MPLIVVCAERALSCVKDGDGLHLLLSARSAVRPAAARPCAAETVRRAAVATLFAVHIIRFGIYLRPDQGRRVTQA